MDGGSGCAEPQRRVAAAGLDGESAQIRGHANFPDAEIQAIPARCMSAHTRWRFPSPARAKLFGIPLVHEVNGTYGDLYVAHPGARHGRRFLDAMQRRQFRWAAGVICVTPQLAQWVKNEIENRPIPVATIPNGANVELFSPSATISDAGISGQLRKSTLSFSVG